MDATQAVNASINILSAVNSLAANIVFVVIRAIFIAFSVILLGAIIYFLKKTSYMKVMFWQDMVELFSFKPYGSAKVAKDWKKTIKRLDTGVESEYKLAIIEADAMLDFILKRMGYSGDSLGVRLKQLTKVQVSNIEAVKAAHEMRNNIVRDPDFHLGLDQSKKAMAAYHKALDDLQVF